MGLDSRKLPTSAAPMTGRSTRRLAQDTPEKLPMDQLCRLTMLASLAKVTTNSVTAEQRYPIITPLTTSRDIWCSHLDRSSTCLLYTSRNPLASPDLTGVASGASFGAAWAIVLGAGTSVQIMGGAFVMGSLSLLLVLALVRWAGMERTGAYILAGVIVSSAADAGLMVLKTCLLYTSVTQLGGEMEDVL